MRSRLLAGIIGAVMTGGAPAALAADSALTIYSRARQDGMEPRIYLPVTGGQNAQGYAVIRHSRTVELAAEENVLKFSDIAALIDPSTVQFRSLTDPAGTKLVEQGYQFDLVSQEKLLEKYIGQQITVHITAGSTSETVAGILLSTQGGLMLEAADGGVRLVNNYSGITFPDLPGDLVTRPTLVWNVLTGKPGAHEIEISYQTQGVDWWADYNLVYQDGKDANSGTLDIGSWVSILNQSGASYKEAALKLVAGDVQQVQNNKMGLQRAMLMESDAAAAPAFAGKSFSEYHLYTLNRPVSLADNATKQLELMPTIRAVPVEKLMVYNGLQPQYWGAGGQYLDRGIGLEAVNKKVEVYLKFLNKEETGLGMPLPGGRMRISQRDSDGQLEFIGESSIDHTARNEEVLVKFGSAFDVTGERRQLNYVLDTANNFAEEEIEIIIRNQKKQRVAVKILENLYRATGWTIKSSTQDYEKENATQIRYLVSVDPEKEHIIRYIVRYTW